jgi:uncharacterized protein (TIGR03435 family)
MTLDSKSTIRVRTTYRMRSAILTTVVVVFGAGTIFGQLPTLQPAFQTASVKPTGVPQPHGKCGDSPDARLMCGGPGTATPTTVTFRAARPIDLLETAYGLEDGVNQIVGLNRFGFAWNDFYHVVATVPRGTTKDQVGPMLQNLLAERFHLVAHRETRKLKVYELVVGESPLKMKRGGTTAAPANARRGYITLDKDGFPQLGPGCSGMAGGGIGNSGGTRIGARNVDLAGFIGELEDWLARPVLNRTGLTGKYDFTFEYSREGLAGPEGGGGLTRPTDDGVLRLVRDVREQLGLILRENSAPVDVVVIDHIDEMPTED